MVILGRLHSSPIENLNKTHHAAKNHERTLYCGSTGPQLHQEYKDQVFTEFGSRSQRLISRYPLLSIHGCQHCSSSLICLFSTSEAQPTTVSTCLIYCNELSTRIYHPLDLINSFSTPPVSLATAIYCSRKNFP
mmetsp:Transcript_966/g.2723  ORF Transcript_966/g.2723 Transcript_966/m.2723 type:complete len:134 (+) Transcript_966:401-802(+)